MNKNKPADLGIVADIKEVLTELNKEPVRQDYKAWHDQINDWKTEFPLIYKEKLDSGPASIRYGKTL